MFNITAKGLNVARRVKILNENKILTFLRVESPFAQEFQQELRAK